MAAQKTTESVVQNGFIGLGTDGVADEGPAGTDVLTVASDDVCGDVGQVWLAPSQQVWSRFAKHVFDALCDE